jgi:uncharacterized protein involved in tolerance to divalent cations
MRGRFDSTGKFISPELKLLLERAEKKLVTMEKALNELEKYDLPNIAKVET